MHKCTYRSNTITRIRKNRKKFTLPEKRANGIYTPEEAIEEETTGNDET
jgi:hypothetical protein